MIDVLISGKLRGGVAVKLAANGKRYALFKLAASDKKGEGVFCSCIAFSQSVIDTVLELQSGDSVSVSGEAAISTWQGKDGTTKHGLDVTAHLAMTAYHAGRKRSKADTTTSQPPPDDAFYQSDYTQDGMQSEDF